ncbi:hypothetical protein N7472_001884 [Penicillium cf. griseofulvum]|uniref:Uncharacterized protein n=1 Tax=Penicillium cf. griseofulvum TaxID=2972120 RepID=A0A9W9MQ27_9EURO|nr:hypothetical protein N7472_001884 [Penicillium cf. griseofulvum]KAJ5437385.1 hypothetical protein N7445_005929 [Penicillium cf. griseofulvum]
MPFGHLPFDYHVMVNLSERQKTRYRKNGIPILPLQEPNNFVPLLSLGLGLKYPDGDNLLPEEIPPYVP